jgi:hypothetical protein
MSVANYFPTGRPAAPEDVVDRQDFIAEAVERLWSGNDIMLAGPRRTGKSSVAGEVLLRLRERGAYTAYVDVFRAVSIESLAAQVLQAALEQRTGFLHHVARDMREISRVVAQARIAAKIHDLELGLQLANEKAAPAEHLEIALTTAERIAKADGRRMIILFDEFQDVLRLGGEDTLKQMRAIIQRQNHVVYLFMGSQADMMGRIFGQPKRAFFRFAVQMQLPEIPWGEWETYIRDRLGRSRHTISDQALQLLEERTGGHPHCVMMVMEAALVRAKLMDRDAITAEDALHAYDDAHLSLSGIYAQQWALVKGYAHAPAVLWQIVQGRPPYAVDTVRTNVAKALALLQQLGLINKVNRGHYHLVEPMFGAWIAGQRGDVEG